MDVVLTLFVGALIGRLASLIMRTDNQIDTAGYLFFGIFGSGIGHGAASALGVAAESGWRLGLGVIGAMLLIALFKAIGVYR